MKRFALLSAILLCAFSCKDEAASDIERRMTNGILLTNSDEAYNEAGKKRNVSGFSAPFEIEDVSRIGNILTIEVSHAHACQGNFEVIWDGSIMESSPQQTRLFVKFNATCSEDPNIMMLDIETLKVDLMELTGDEKLIEETIFHVSNASSAQDVNYDKTTSSE